MDDLKQKTTRAFQWRFATVFGQVVMRLVVTCILARLLSIHAFGLIGQAMIFTGLVTVFSEIGMAPVLIQRDKISQEEISHAYTISFLLGCFWTCCLYFSAPGIAAWFESPPLTSLIQVISLTFLFSGFTLTTLATLQRDLNFQRIFWIELCSYLIGYGVVGITMAILGAGVWSLVYALLVQSMLQLVTAFALARRWPSFGFRWSVARSLMGQGAGFSIARMVLFAARNVDALLIGKFLGVNAIGLYRRSYNFMALPINSISGITDIVLFPTYSRIQNEQLRLKKLFLDNLSSITLVVFPLMAFMFISGREIIILLLGEKWEAAILPFQLLCIGGIPLCAVNTCETLGRSCGSIRGRVNRHLIYLTGISIVVYALAPYGLPAVVAGISGCLFVQWLLMGHLAIGLLKCKWMEFFTAHLLGAVMAVVVAFATGFLREILTSQLELTSVIAILAGLIGVIAPVYLLTLAVLPIHFLPGPARQIRSRIGHWLRPSTMVAGLTVNPNDDVAAEDKLNAA